MFFFNQANYDAWKMMIKAVALYRDGSKLSQPLNSTLEKYPELQPILEDTSGEEIQVNEVRKSVKIGSRDLLLIGRREGEKLSEVSYVMNEIAPAQKAMMQALINSVNLGLTSGLNPSLIAANSLQVEGNPLIKELATFLKEFNSSTIKETEITGSSIQDSEDGIQDSEEGTQKCGGCGASQLRRNGTCMLCEVCGETTGCS